MHIKIKSLLMVVLGSFYQVISIPVVLIIPQSSGQVRSLALLQMPIASLEKQRLFEAVHHKDIPAITNTSRLIEVCKADVALQSEHEKYQSLRALFARYIENAHLFGDEGLVPALFDNDSHRSMPWNDEDDNLCVENFEPVVVDSTVIINQVVSEILKRHSFDNLETVSLAIQELQNGIKQAVFIQGSPACQTLVTDLSHLNSEPLSASYGCMQKVSRVLAQLPPESSQAIREQLPWYLRRMV